MLRNTITSFPGEEFGDLYAAKRGGVEKAEPRAGALEGKSSHTNTHKHSHTNAYAFKDNYDKHNHKTC